MMFANRLTQKQVEEFIRQHGIQAEVNWIPQAGEIIICHQSGEIDSVIHVNDIILKAPRDYEIFTGDWQVFLRSIFDKPYMGFLGQSDVENDFVCELSDRDIMDLVPFQCLYDFEERPALLKGTRRFIIKKEFDGPKEELIIGPLYRIGTVCFYGVTKKSFQDYMNRKFGRDYQKWCERRNMI